MEATRLALVLSEKDIEADTRSAIKAHRSGTKVLGDQDVQRRLMDAMPAAIAKRVRQILPDGLTIGSIEVTLELSGKIFDCGVSGDVKVVFVPKK